MNEDSVVPLQSDRMHLHRISGQYYTILRGTRNLQAAEELVEITAGETLEVPPAVRYVSHATHTQLEGSAFRVSLLSEELRI